MTFERAVPATPPETKTCAKCGEAMNGWYVDPLTPRLICVPCYQVQEAIASDQRRDLVEATAQITRNAKEHGHLSDQDAAWLVRIGCKDSVEALGKRFQDTKENSGTKRAARDRL